MRFWIMLLLVLLLAGCSAAAFQGYGPKGQGHIGSAYGYQDQLLADGKYLVSYTGSDVFEARTGLNRRAAELCRGEYALAVESGNRASSMAVEQMIGGMAVTTGIGGTIDAVAQVHCR